MGMMPRKHIEGDWIARLEFMRGMFLICPRCQIPVWEPTRTDWLSLRIIVL